MAVEGGAVLRAVLTELARKGQRYIPVGVSMRHVHLSEQDLEKLFGRGFQLHPLRNLTQPGQYAATEQVALEGPKGTLEKVRIIGPVRKETQVEMSLTDAMSIGFRHLPVRMSGQLDQTPGIRIIGPAGAVETSRGSIVAARHVHLSQSQAMAYGLHDGQVITLRSGGERPCTFGNVMCRVGEGHELEFHIDTDEANAALLKNGDLLEMVLPEEEPADTTDLDQDLDLAGIVRRVVNVLTGKPQVPEDYRIRAGRQELAADQIFELITEQEVNQAADQGQHFLYCALRGIVTPAAVDRAAQWGIQILRVEEKSHARGIDPSVPAGTELLSLVTAQDLNLAFRKDQKELYCTMDALITPAAMERIAETGIRIVRI